MKFLTRLRRARRDPKSTLQIERDIAVTILEAERVRSQELEYLLSEAQADLQKLQNAVRWLKGKERVVVMMVDSECVREPKKVERVGFRSREAFSS